MSFAILLPSAEGKRPGGNPYAPDMFDYRTPDTFNYFSELNPERRQLIRALQKHVRKGDQAAHEKLFGVKGKTLEEAVEVTGDIFESPLMAAIDRYGAGVMYEAMDFQELPTGAQRRLLENGVIFSGLFGLLRPDDLVPNYRLKIDAAVDGVGKAAAYWKPLISPLLNGVVKGKHVWNLLPQAYQAAWDDDGSYRRMIEVKFYREDESGKRSPVSHEVKKLRGALTHYIATEAAESIDALRPWDAPEGYEIDDEATTFDKETKSGVLVMVQYPDWEERRAKRKAALAAEEAARLRAEAARKAEEEEDEPEDEEEEENDDD